MECGGMGRCALSSPARSRPSYQRLPQVRSLNPNPRFQSFLHAQERVPEQYLLLRLHSTSSFPPPQQNTFYGF